MATSTFSKWFTNKRSFKLSLRRTKSSPDKRCSITKTHHQFREAFRRFDSDGDGKISCHELRSFFTWSGDHISLEDAEGVMRDFDSDGDGLMDYGDFMRLMEKGSSHGGKEEEEEDLRRAFEMFEVEKGSGFITPGGLQHVLGRLGEAKSHDECAAMIRAYDLDGNGVLDYHEFHQMMMA